MKDLTISLKDEVAKWLRIHAAKEGKSASGVLAELISSLMQREESYQSAMAKFLLSPITPLKSTSEKYPNREELHDRK